MRYRNLAEALASIVNSGPRATPCTRVACGPILNIIRRRYGEGALEDVRGITNASDLARRSSYTWNDRLRLGTSACSIFDESATASSRLRVSWSCSLVSWRGSSVRLVRSCMDRRPGSAQKTWLLSSCSHEHPYVLSCEIQKAWYANMQVSSRRSNVGIHPRTARSRREGKFSPKLYLLTR